jgi:hypothetical protein
MQPPRKLASPVAHTTRHENTPVQTIASNAGIWHNPVTLKFITSLQTTAIPRGPSGDRIYQPSIDLADIDMITECWRVDC